MDCHNHLPTYLTMNNAFHTKNYSKFSRSDIRHNDTRARLGLPTSWHIDLCAFNKAQNAWQRDLKGHTSCVNAVEFNKTEDLFATGGDDLRVLLWRVSNALTDYKPLPFTIMKTKHDSNIFALAFTHDSKKVMSAGNDDRFIVHDIETGKPIQSYRGSTYYCLSVHGDNQDIVAAATDNSRVYLYDIRAPPGEPVQCLREIGENFCVNFNQKIPYLMAVCNKSKGLSVIDIRAGNDDFCIRAGPATKEAIYASWNESGDALFCIRSGKLPVYLDTKKQVPLICKDDSYRNSITIKSCDFVGNDYVITGSDKWDIYCWKIPKDYDDKVEEGKLYAVHPETDQAYTTFEGHRSIVNHCRYSKTDDIILSCGVEKIVKLWSGSKLSTSYRERPRRGPFIINLEEDDEMDEDNDLEDDEDESEDINTLRLFDQYMRTEGSNEAYTVEGERRRSNGSSSNHQHEVPPPIFRNELPETNRFRSGAGFIREILQQLVHSPHLDLQDLDSDDDDDDEDDSNNNDDDLNGFFVDSDEDQFRFVMASSPEESSLNESSSSSSSSDTTDNGSSSSSSSDSSSSTMTSVTTDATQHESDGSQGREIVTPDEEPIIIAGSVRNEALNKIKKK